MIYKRAVFRMRSETAKKSRRGVTINRIYLRVNKPRSILRGHRVKVCRPISLGNMSGWKTDKNKTHDTSFFPPFVPFVFFLLLLFFPFLFFPRCFVLLRTRGLPGQAIIL